MIKKLNKIATNLRREEHKVNVKNELILIKENQTCKIMYASYRKVYAIVRITQSNDMKLWYLNVIGDCCSVKYKKH